MLDKCKDKLLDNPKIYDLIKAWEDYGFSTDTLNLARCIPPNQSHVHVACNVDSFWDQLWNWPLIWNRHPVKGLKQQNVTVNSLVPHKKGKMVTKKSVASKSKFGETLIRKEHHTKLKTDNSTVKHFFF